MAISFVGAGAQSVSTTSGGTLTAAWPTGYTAVANDVGVLVLVGKHNNNTSLQAPATLTGWTLVGTQFVEAGTYDLQLTVWIRRLTAALAAPAVTVPAAYSTTSGGLTAQVAVYRGVSTTTLQDATAVLSSQTGTATTNWQPTGITTVTGGAWVLSIVGSADDNALGLDTANGFTTRMSGADYDTTTGGDVAVGLADEEALSPGAVTNPIWTQTLVAADQWVGLTLALRPEPTNATPTPSTISSSVSIPTFTVTPRNASVTTSTISATASLPASSAASSVFLTPTLTNTVTASTSTTSWSVAVNSTADSGDYFYAFIAVDNSGSQGAAPVLLDGSDVTNTNSANLSFSGLTEVTADPAGASAGTTLIVLEGTVSGPVLATDTFTITFTNSVTFRAALVYRVRPAPGFGMNRPNYSFTALGAESAGTATSSISLPISGTTAPSSSISGSTLNKDQILFVAAALETNATVTGDSDTTDGSWSSLGQGIANSGTAGTSQTVLAQWKRISAGQTDQTWNASWTGATDWSAFYFALEAIWLPSPVRNVVAGPITNNSCTLTWDAPLLMGYPNRNIYYSFGYRIPGDPGFTPYWDPLFQPYKFYTTTGTISDVLTASAYEIIVYVSLENGGGPQGEIVAASIPITVTGTWGWNARIGG